MALTWFRQRNWKRVNYSLSFSIRPLLVFQLPDWVMYMLNFSVPLELPNECSIFWRWTMNLNQSMINVCNLVVKLFLTMFLFHIQVVQTFRYLKISILKFVQVKKLHWLAKVDRANQQ